VHSSETMVTVCETKEYSTRFYCTRASEDLQNLGGTYFFKENYFILSGIGAKLSLIISVIIYN
jgi:hypothetical protein